MAKLFRNALLIVNPRAGRAGNLSVQLERARAKLAASGIETELAMAGSEEQTREVARAATANGAELVIACGGDGTLNAVVNGMAGSKVPLALLPAGTANVLAKELGLPWDVERAAEEIPRGRFRRIALGKVTTYAGGLRDRYFLSVAGAGPDGAMVQAVNDQLKRHTGTLAYWAEGFRQFFSYRFPRFRVIVGEQTLPASLVVVGRTKHYGGPLRITNLADLFGNDFQLMVCGTRSRTVYMTYIPLACIGRMDLAPAACFIKANGFRCEPNDGDTVWLQVDGEPAGQLPAEFNIVPDALTLLVPERVG